MELKFCKICCMDGSAEEIEIDEQGKCNFCKIAERELELAEKNKPNLTDILTQIKIDGVKGEYDCLIGLSGGADSSTVLVRAVELGLRPLAFGMDNGWNDPRADENVMRLVEGLKVPYFRATIDLKKFKELQGAFMRAGLINIEIPTDHVLMAITYEVASKYGIKWILSGGNVATESIMPASWSYNARDLTHIKDVFKKITGKKLKGLPVCGLWKWNYYKWVKKIKVFYLLDYLNYDREAAIKELNQRFGYKDYGEKHCESVFTWWFQNFYLFNKFGIDKRKAHLSSMIKSGQIKRHKALEILGLQPVYPELGLEQRALRYPKHKHSDFKQDKWYNRIAKVVRYASVR